MNRTLLIFGAAGALALVALFVSPRGPRPVDPQPRPHPSGNGALQMEARFSHPMIAPGLSETFATIDVRAVDVAGLQRSPVNLALVIDRSTSMEGVKLANAKAAARQLISELNPNDTLALIHYGSEVEVLPSKPMTPANREAMLAAVEAIEDNGGTNIGDALREAEQALPQQGLRRIILVSDGQPTVGITNPAALIDMSRTLRAHGINVSAIGVGDLFNEDLMAAIAELGAGSYGYLRDRDSSQLASLFSRDLHQASTLVARNVEARVELPSGVALKEVLGYRFRQEGRTVHIPLTDFAAGQQERVVLALSVQATTTGTSLSVAQVDLSYDDLLAHHPATEVAALSTEVTEQVAMVESRQDKVVAVNAARAQGAANVRRAADALEQGNKEEAKAILTQNEELFRSASKVAGAPAVADDQKSLDELMKDFDTSASGEARSYSIKGAKKKALQDFGRSTY